MAELKVNLISNLIQRFICPSQAWEILEGKKDCLIYKGRKTCNLLTDFVTNNIPENLK